MARLAKRRSMGQREDEVRHKKKKKAHPTDGKERRTPRGRPDTPRSLRERRGVEPRQSRSRLTGEPVQGGDGRDRKSPLVPASPRDPSQVRSAGMRREQNSILLLKGPPVSSGPKSPVGLSGSPPGTAPRKASWAR